MRDFRYGRVLLAGLLFALAASASPETTSGALTSAYVKPVDFNLLEKRFQSLPEWDRDLVRLYMKGAQRHVLTLEDGVFPNAGTEHWRNIAERAHGAAILAAVAGDWPQDLRKRCRGDSARFVQEFVAEFKRKSDLGNEWQCSWWAAEMGTAAWFVWDLLAPEVRNDVADMVVFHADRIAARKPGAKVEGDTEAETVAWNSAILSLAANMMPGHPRNPAWQDAAKHYVYTILGTSSDLKDSSPGDDGKPVKDWVAGANIHDDFSLENHNRFHIDYVFTTYRFIIGGAALYRLAGNPLPQAFTHHIAEMHEHVVRPCMNGGKFAVFVSDNDWKRYHIWTESAAVHGYVSLVTSSPLASALEGQALKNAAAYWDEFLRHFQYDNPYVCGKAWTPRIADIVLMHLLAGPTPQPMATAEVETALKGTHEKKDIHLLTQYSAAGSFRSFFWGPGPVVRHVEPKDNSWMLLPLESNYRLHVDGSPKPDKGAVTKSGRGTDWFWVMRSYPHGEDEAFVSLPGETVVIMTSFCDTALSGAKTLDSRIAVEKPHGVLTIYSRDGEAVWRPSLAEWDRTGQERDLNLDSNWVNLSDSIGYVVFNLSMTPSRMVLPKPGARSAMSLFHADPWGGGPLGLITCVFPNQSHEQTAAAASQIKGTWNDRQMTCLAGDCFVVANFSDRESSVSLPSGKPPEGTARISPRSVDMWERSAPGEPWARLK